MKFNSPVPPFDLFLAGAVFERNSNPELIMGWHGVRVSLRRMLCPSCAVLATGIREAPVNPMSHCNRKQENWKRRCVFLKTDRCEYILLCVYDSMCMINYHYLEPE